MPDTASLAKKAANDCPRYDRENTTEGSIGSGHLALYSEYNYLLYYWNGRFGQVLQPPELQCETEDFPQQWKEKADNV